MSIRLEGPQQLVRTTPSNDNLRFILSIIRRMGTHGLRDAAACNAVMRHFGGCYRQPWLLMQTMILDLSRHSRQTITIAPVCCQRMTTDESQLIEVIAQVECNPARALLLLNDLTGNSECHGLAATISAVRQAFASQGRLLEENY